jgi:hypothetical protein
LIHIDLGIGDPVTPAPRLISTSFTIGEGSLTWQVYPVETILAEKLHAMVILGDRNSRAKDVYDVQLFLPQANPTMLREAIKATFTFRGDQLPATIWEALASIDTSVLKRGWATAVATTKGPRLRRRPPAQLTSLKSGRLVFLGGLSGLAGIFVATSTA